MGALSRKKSGREQGPGKGTPPRGERRRFRQRLNDLSLKQSFMLYMLVFLLIATFASSLIINLLDNMRQETIFRYVYSYDQLDGYSDLHLYLTSGVLVPFLPEDTARLQLARWGSALTIPVVFSACIVWAGLRFFQRRLRPAIRLLSSAAGRIGQNDLDFTIQYGRSDEMGRLCASFEAMRAALAENNAALWRTMEERRRFVRIFAHDLRTPLTVLRGYTELLQENAGENADILAAMNAHLTRMEGYVSGMSALRRLEDAAPAPGPQDPEALLREIRGAAQVLCDQAGLSLLVSHGPLAGLWLDRGLFLQIYDNLLSNAVRYAKSRLCVSLEQREGFLSLTVANDGPPFTAEQLCSATQPYYTGEDSGGHFGLGLCICEQLCKAQGGFLSLANTEAGAAVTASVALG